MTAVTYCRAVESYLCRKNDGHLIRIVGPVFELVRGWEADGIPVSIVERAIDRRYARYHATGPKRRPLSIEYCEADVLDLFDEWRRAVGVGVGGAREPPSRPETNVAPRRRRRSLTAHLDDVAARLAAWAGGADLAGAGADTLIRRVGQMAAVVRQARGAGGGGLRGAARAEVIDQLRAFEHELVSAVRGAADDALVDTLRAEARMSLEPFRRRLAPAAFEQAVAAATDRLLAEHFRLPPLTYE